MVVASIKRSNIEKEFRIVSLQRNQISLNNVASNIPIVPQSLKFRNAGFLKLKFKCASFHHLLCMFPLKKEEKEEGRAGVLPRRRSLHSLGDIHSAPPRWPAPGL